MKRLGSACALAAIGLMLSSPARSQVGFGGYVAGTTAAFGDSRGVGLRLQLGMPLFPISLALNGEYFFANCPPDDCALRGASLDVNYTPLPLPILRPWVGAGWSIRAVEVAGRKSTERGINVGVGARLELTSFQPFIDLRYLLGHDGNPYVFRIGLMLR